MAIGPGNVVEDPKAMFLQHISEHGSVVTNTEEPPAAEAPAAKAQPNTSEAIADPDDEDEDFDLEGSLESLSRKMDSLSRPQPATRTEAAPTAKTAERSALRDRIAKLGEGLDPDDTRTPAMLEALGELTDRLEAQERREAQREEAAAEEAQARWESNYEKNVVKFQEKYPGVDDKALVAIGRQHAKMIERDESAKALSFEEVARRMYGDDALEARKAKGSPAGNGAPKAPNGRTDPPSGSPIPSRSTGGGPPKKFSPGPGRGVGDVTDHLKKVGAFRGVISER